MHKVVTFLAVLVAVVASGCGDGSLSVPTATVATGTRVSPERYLADAASGAAAVRTFAQELDTMGPVATESGLRAVAPRLTAPLDQARTVGQRLEAERLADRRLEDQRARTAGAFRAVVTAMEGVVAAAGAGSPDGAQAASRALRTAIDALRAIPASSP